MYYYTELLRGCEGSFYYFNFTAMVLYSLLFVSFCFISFINLLKFSFFFYLLRTGLFHCELHHITGLIVEKV